MGMDCRLYEALGLFLIGVLLSGCGRYGETEFVVGAQPSSGLGSYNREAIIESPHGREFAWVSAAPCPDGSLIVVGGDADGADAQVWISQLTTLEGAVTWHSMPSTWTGTQDAALQCLNDKFIIVSVAQAEPPIGQVTYVVRSSWPVLDEVASYTVNLPAQSYAPSLDVREQRVSAIFAIPGNESVQALEYHFENDQPTFIEERQITLQYPAPQRDLSWKAMRQSDGSLISTVTGYGATAESGVSLWLSLKGNQPMPLDYNESFTTQQLIRWNDRFWIVGTRLRPTVPLGALFAVQRDTVPTLREAH